MLEKRFSHYMRKHFIVSRNIHLEEQQNLKQQKIEQACCLWRNKSFKAGAVQKLKEERAHARKQAVQISRVQILSCRSLVFFFVLVLLRFFKRASSLMFPEKYLFCHTSNEEIKSFFIHVPREIFVLISTCLIREVVVLGIWLVHLSVHFNRILPHAV